MANHTETLIVFSITASRRSEHQHLVYKHFLMTILLHFHGSAEQADVVRRTKTNQRIPYDGLVQRRE